MRILVTGSDGFIGSALVKELRYVGHRVMLCPRYEPFGPLLDELKPDAIAHLAGIPPYGPIRSQISENVELVRELAVESASRGIKVVLASTPEMFDHNALIEAREVMTPWGPSKGLFHMVKTWAEELCQRYAAANFASMRFSLPYGPGQPLACELMKMIWQGVYDAEVVVYSNTFRSWTYIGDAARAARLVVERGTGSYNIGRDDDASWVHGAAAAPTETMADWATTICELVGRNPEATIELTDNPLGPGIVLNRPSTAAIRDFGWRPTVGMRTGLEESIAYVKETFTEDGSFRPVKDDVDDVAEDA